MKSGSAEVLQLQKAGRHAWRLAWVLVAIQVAATAGGIASYGVIPKRYESTTTIRVERQQLANPLAPQERIDTDDIESRVRSLREEILSPDYFDKVIDRLGLDEPGQSGVRHEALVQGMIGNTEILTRQRDTFQITYGGEDPGTVRDVTNALAGIFIEESLESKSGDASAVVDFLEGQLEAYRAKLEESDAALRQFEEAHVDQVPATRAAQLARLEQIRTNLIEVQNSLKQARLQRDLVRQRLTGEGEGGPGGEVRVPNPLAERIREREEDLRRLLLDFSESYPDVVALRAEIAQMRRELEAQPTVRAEQVPEAGRNPVQDALTYGQLERLELEVSSLAARELQLQAELARIEKRVQGIPEVEQRLAALRRDYDVNNDIYNSFLRRLEEARVSQELELTKKGEVFRILQAAALPLTPTRPTKPQVLALGIGAGLALNAALLLLVSLWDTSFQSVAEVREALGVPVLVGVTVHRGPRERTLLRLKAVALVVLALAYAAGVGVFLFWRQLSPLLAGAV